MRNRDSSTMGSRDPMGWDGMGWDGISAGIVVPVWKIFYPVEMVMWVRNTELSDKFKYLANAIKWYYVCGSSIIREIICA
jgi:hypothetical protein